MRLFVAILIPAMAGAPATAQRRPVLPQIDLPHAYYFREMYLPQLTSGPSSVAWSPDSKEVVFSMAGSLWRQKMDSREALQLTDGPGYDYQADWSPDGRSVIYVSYQKDAIELRLLDLASGKSWELTGGGAVNVEPRWSPDGKRIVFVSTMYNKRFHVFRADVAGTRLENVVRLTGETQSGLPRYYYSTYDTEISPVWTRDGNEILFVSNRGHIYGTGGFWRMRAEPGAQAREIHYEETNWKARPDVSPDGSRIVYSSYLGRQWHQLWVMPANGGDAFPISYGDWDDTNPRWSPDGKVLAFISNRDGNTALWVTALPGGNQNEVICENRNYIQPHASLHITILDAAGDEEYARVSVTDARGKFYAPAKSWIFADDGFDRSQRPFEPHYFYAVYPRNEVFFTAPAEGNDAPPSSHHAMTVDVPLGTIAIEAQRGLGQKPNRQTFTIRHGDNPDVAIQLADSDWESGAGGHWISGDAHVHMNYGGAYRNDPRNLRDQAEAEGLHIVNNLIVNKEQRFPDFAYSGRELDGASDEDVLIFHGQEFHTSYWGHRGILGGKGPILLPGYAGYPNTAAASLYPMNADVYDLAHAQGAIVGAVHPFDEVPDPFAKPPQKITDELPVDVASGKLDYMEIVGFSDHKSTAAIWYKLLNLGFRIPAAAGTDATTDYAAPIRSQVGADRVYAWVREGPLNIEVWFAALKRGRTFATNGPLIEFTLDGQRVGEELKYEQPRESVAFTAKLRSIVPVDHLEVVCNGRVVRTLKLEGARDSADVSGTLPLERSGWCLLRTWSDRDEYPVLDNYVYATTSPVYVTIAGMPPRSPADAKYFAAWVARTIEITSRYPDWNSAREKAYVLKRLAEAKAIYENLE